MLPAGRRMYFGLVGRDFRFQSWSLLTGLSANVNQRDLSCVSYRSATLPAPYLPVCACNQSIGSYNEHLFARNLLGLQEEGASPESSTNITAREQPFAFSSAAVSTTATVTALSQYSRKALSSILLAG